MQASEDPHTEAGHPAPLVTERLHLLRAYRHAWDGRAAEEISPWLERCWRATSSYVNPILDSVRGPQDLAQVILNYEHLFPDHAIRPTGGVAIHHDLASYRWCLSSSAPIRLLGHDFGTMITGYDVVEFDDVGITRVIEFFDGLAQHPAWDQPPIHQKG